MRIRKERSHLCLLITFTLLFLCCNSENQTTIKNSSVQVIEELLNDYYDTMTSRNWESYREYFISDATLTTIWQAENDTIPKISTHSISEFIAQTKDGPDSQPIFEEKMLSSEIDEKNNLAQAWVRYKAKFGTTDNLIEWNGTDLFSFIRYNNEWKIVSIVFESE